ncbi:MAG: HhoA/HhoB/HtrA family serine endopeptidase [Leptolyngbyaceae cyanobacterium]
MLESIGLGSRLMRVLAAFGMVVLTFLGSVAPASAQTPSSEAAITAQAIAAPTSQSFVAAAVQRVGPAVVRIDTEKTVVRDNPSLLFEDPFFRDFFGGPDGFSRLPREQLLRGQGSGFIISASGDVLTNAHVVDDADRVTVTLKDGRTFDAVVEGVDGVTDLAVVKIEDSDSLPVAPLGDSDAVLVGDWAIAVGNPLGLDNTVTLGIVSTLKRSSAAAGIPGKRIDFIQTDAAINPGNSGGPLLNQAGEVIGINTAIRADAMGIGFAIPINKAKTIKDQLAQGESIAHPYLGVQIATLTPEIAQRNNDDPNAGMMLPEVIGALVIRVIPDTPAAESGLRRGDVIVKVDDQPVASADTLQSQVDQSRVGQTLKLTVKRGNQTQQIRVNTAELQN